jgi:AcrR family transcriptional regulator
MRDDTPFAGTAVKSRAERRREDTRRRLMLATYTMIALRGADNLVIQDITEAADVGYGSFYNHFSTKDAIVDAVIDAARERSLSIYHAASAGFENRVEAFALELRMCLQQCLEDKTWAWYLVRTFKPGGGCRIGLFERLQRSIAAGTADGSFVCHDVEMTQAAIGGLLLIAALSMASSPMPEDYPERVAAEVLRQLHVPAQEIERVLNIPLPNTPIPPFLAHAA